MTKHQVLLMETYKLYIIIIHNIRHILKKETMKIIKTQILPIYIHLRLLQLSTVKVQFQLNNGHLKKIIIKLVTQYIFLFISILCIFYIFFVFCRTFIFFQNLKNERSSSLIQLFFIYKNHNFIFIIYYYLFIILNSFTF